MHCHVKEKRAFVHGKTFIPVQKGKFRAPYNSENQPVDVEEPNHILLIWVAPVGDCDNEWTTFVRYFIRNLDNVCLVTASSVVTTSGKKFAGAVSTSGHNQVS